ncbi:hypothetical protein [Candidatus Leptofilum sp.]|uniref:hypothetical protein n=1 Tax=Candidatus Leptofilum sp. TaxID=3241576 RepID=UPI003B5BBDAD
MSGNSGGGVWVDGQLVGNMWTTTMEVGRSWLSGQSADSLAQTSQSLAAQMPVSLLQ